MSQSLTEKYRPASLDAVRGQPKIVRALRAFVKDPVSQSFLFYSAEPGTGKSSTAEALAGELGIEVGNPFGGFHKVDSGKLDAAAVDEVISKCHQTPWTKSRWHLVLFDEAETMTGKAADKLLSAMDKMPPHAVFVLTTNHRDQLSAPLRDRCESFTFDADIKALREDAGKLVSQVWEAELGHNHAPTLAEIGIKYEYGALSFRNVLKKLEPILRMEKAGEQWREEPAEVQEKIRIVAPPAAVKARYEVGDTTILGKIVECNKMSGNLYYRIGTKWYNSFQLQEAA